MKYKTNAIKRFEGMIKKYDDGCWFWTGSKDRNGYGKMRFSHDGLRDEQLAHRISYTLFVGDIPEGMCVLHVCDNPFCVNPQHLWLGTMQDNSIDRSEKGRGWRPIGELHHMSKLNDEDVIEMRRLYKTGDYRKRELALMFGVSFGCAKDVLSRRTWRHIK
jgi:hypothetical protein